MDLAMFDVFRGAGADKDALWLEAVSSPTNAQRRMEEIAAREPGQYFVFSPLSQSIFARIDTRKSTSPLPERKSERFSTSNLRRHRKSMRRFFQGWNR
jgi:hypothetical protein